MSTTPPPTASPCPRSWSHGLGPRADPKRPDDVFLFIGSDNDFQNPSGHGRGMAFDAEVKAADGSPAGDNDNLILVYRLTLPGWSALTALARPPLARWGTSGIGEGLSRRRNLALASDRPRLGVLARVLPFFLLVGPASPWCDCACWTTACARPVGLCVLDRLPRALDPLPVGDRRAGAALAWGLAAFAGAALAVMVLLADLGLGPRLDT